MYEIRPSNADPAFLDRGTLLFPPRFLHVLEKNTKVNMVMTDRHLFMGNNAYGVIWDFIKGRYRFWFVRGWDSSEPVEVRHSCFTLAFCSAYNRRVADNFTVITGHLAWRPYSALPAVAKMFLCLDSLIFIMAENTSERTIAFDQLAA